MTTFRDTAPSGNLHLEDQPLANPAMQTKVIDLDNEIALLQAIELGSEKAFENFYLIYHPRLYRFILNITHQHEVVEEVIQDTLMVVWEKADRFNNTCKVSTWIFGIAYRKALKAIARAGRGAGHEDVDELGEVLADPRASADASLEHAGWLETSLSELSREHRAVIELTFLHGLSYKEIAEILDCPENTVKTRMFHARKKLQAAMSEVS
jgi:RNA polymerase sigma-70 factor (ECF subfamily)